VAGQTYTALSGTATIPVGSTSVDVEVVPLLDAAITEDKTVALALAAGLYGIAEQAGSAEMTVVNLVVPSGYNVWVATEDGLASVGSNWSAGHAPLATENVLFDGRFSTANCEWDAAASATVASWTQNADYTGTVEIQTTYASGAFPLLSIVGDCVVSGGKWTHPANNDSEAYRLKVSVGGDFTLAAAATIVTALELLTGLLVNRDHQVWDYRQMPCNYLGQICLPYSLLWLPVSLMAMGLYTAAANAVEKMAADA
jgi:hypothetical protein